MLQPDPSVQYVARLEIRTGGEVYAPGTEVPFEKLARWPNFSALVDSNYLVPRGSALLGSQRPVQAAAPSSRKTAKTTASKRTTRRKARR